MMLKVGEKNKNKIMVIGTDYYHYTESISQAFIQSNFEVIKIKYKDGYPKDLLSIIKCRLLPKVGIKKFQNEYDKKLRMNILDSYISEKPDIVLIIKGSKITKDILQKMKESTIVLWMLDSIFRVDESLRNIRYYDHIFLFESEDVEKLKTQGIVGHFLPLALDTSLYYPQEKNDKEIDVSFVGTIYPAREALFDKIIKDYPRLNIKIFGKYTDIRKPYRFIKFYLKGYNCYYNNKNLSPKDVNTIYSKSKLILNIHHSQSVYSCNPRFFEILGTKSLQVVDKKEYIIDNFKNCVITFNSYEDIKDAIEAMLNNNEFFPVRNIEEGYKNVLREHTYFNRIKSILDVISN